MRRGAAPALVVWSAWLVLMSGANLATPLYALYAKEFRFSSLVLTSVFATYAFVLVPALMLFGRLSDRFGRRPVLLAGLAVACGGLVLFLFAESAAWLYAARALQGLAVGMISGAATAALVELDPADDRRRAALLAGLAQAGGSSLGPLLAGTLAQWAPEPLRLAFYVELALTACAAVAVAFLPEPAAGRREPWRVQVPRVPRDILGRFARVSLTAGTVWAAVALFLSIVPSYAGQIVGSGRLALLAAIAAVALLSSFVAQIAATRYRPPQPLGQVVALAVLALGLAALVAAEPAHSLALLLVGSVAAGAGHGAAFLEAQHELNEIAPAERRGEVTAAFIACIYFLVASAVISTGLLDLAFSLSVAVAVVAVALVASAVASALWQLGTEEGSPSPAGAEAS